jgi:hypothetical protein
MSSFWGYPGADIIALISIPILCLFCLYQARKFPEKM